MKTVPLRKAYQRLPGIHLYKDSEFHSKPDRITDLMFNILEFELC